MFHRRAGLLTAHYHLPPKFVTDSKARNKLPSHVEDNKQAHMIHLGRVSEHVVDVKVYFTWVSADFPESAYSSCSLGCVFNSDTKQLRVKLL